MNLLGAAVTVSFALSIIVIGLIMINPETASKMSIFKDTATEASQASKTAVSDISKTNVSSIAEPIVEKKDDIIRLINSTR